MGVYEGLARDKPGMHWPQSQERHPILITAPYDPSRDLSPNLPTTTPLHHHQPEYMTSLGSSSRSNSGCSTPARLSIGMCCGIKEEYDDCQECVAGGEGRLRMHHHHQEFFAKDYERLKASKRELPSSPPDDEALKLCAGCGRQISDRFYLYAVDRQWHASCLQCSQCGRTLDDEVTCFARDGNIYCRKDYQKLFAANRCFRCKSSISSTELVMRAREFVFHLPCFFCVVCMMVLRKGDHFGMRDGDVYCRLHYESLPQSHLTASSPSQHPEDFSAGPYMQPLPSPEFPEHRGAALPMSHHDDKGGSAAFFNGGVSAPRPKGRPRKRKPKDMDMGSNLDLNADSYIDLPFGSGSMGSGSSHHRSKRMRTSFKHHQLRTMKTYFTVNHNPDAKDLKQLSQKTGLAKRVLQVWFQNARAKWRRMLNKQQDGSGSGGGGGGGVGGGGGIKSMDDKSMDMDMDYHSMSLSSHSPQNYLSPQSMECHSS